MEMDSGGDQKPLDKTCREVSPGVFERKSAKRTARLDCNTFAVSFSAADNAPRTVLGNGYGGRSPQACLSTSSRL